MGHNDRCDAGSLLDLLEFFLHGDLGESIQRTERFIQQDRLRLIDERPCNPGPLGHAAGQIARIGLLKTGQIHEVYIFLNQPCLFFLIDTVESKCHILLHGKPGEQAMFLKYDPPRLFRLQDRLSADRYAAFMLCVQPGDRTKKCAFAAAAGTQQAGQLALCHGETDIIQNFQRCILLFKCPAYVFNFDKIIYAHLITAFSTTFSRESITFPRTPIVSMPTITTSVCPNWRAFMII